MIDHLSLGTHRYPDAVAFYRRVLAPLGLLLQRDSGKEAGFGNDAGWCFWLYPAPAGDAVTAPGVHVALAAPSRAAVEAAHAAALAAAGRDIFTPRLRPDIDDRYYGAMFHDLDGHRIELVTRGDRATALQPAAGVSAIPTAAASSSFTLVSARS